jgi:hypothetical protein
MAMFTVRIELHNGTIADYNLLHSTMMQRGFSRLITSDAGVRYHMPWSEYNFVGNATIDAVFQAASYAAAQTGKTYSVLANEAVRRKWQGLIEVK